MLQAPFLCFFSRPFYQDVANNWTGVGFVYLLALLALAWGLVTARVCIPFAQIMNEHAPKYLNQLPKISVANDKITIDKPSPWQIKDPDSGAILAIFDTSGSPKAEQADAPIVVTSSEFIIKGPSGSSTSANSGIETTRRIPAAGAPPFEMDARQALEMVRLITIVVPFAVYFFGGGVLFTAHFLQVLVYAAIGLIFAAMLDFKLPYSTSMRLTAMAITPNILLSTLFSLLTLNLWPLWPFLTVVISLSYLFFGCKCAASVTASASEQ